MSLQNLFVSDLKKYYTRLTCQELTTNILNAETATFTDLNVNKITAVEAITETLADKWTTINTTASGIYNVPIPYTLQYKVIYENIANISVPIGVQISLPEILAAQDVANSPLFIDWSIPPGLVPATDVYIPCAVKHNIAGNIGVIIINTAGSIIAYNYITGLPTVFSGTGPSRGLHTRTFSYLF